MRFYRIKKSSYQGWDPLWIQCKNANKKTMKRIEIRINGKIYSKWSEELVEAWQADEAWDLLCYREPVKK